MNLHKIYYTTDHTHKTFHENLIKLALQSNPNLYNWVGIYYFEHYLFPNIQWRDLVLGGFIGASSPHVRISLKKNFW
jgi:putative methionine-R-sulfoxide reductase with GAF domain